ncbi:hypothetical protein DFA_09445 [Cavenderia fasciculata]|uniref:EGF-like domain-containing protein n=1 Tax=Cavenderia fasciculata TaxID=261658 RepID=F4Q7M8_CACFS|nr:uncharacterized protein DFA_09445 [Cavenderia fasciculata]EGG16410.1 hypothetical protein DFA_09445 [Cavenderia fasciculata]|eukprot:XP_004354794.1 hypothetical protein DFA_09445 [Cavenderia fasciculata]
MNSKVTSLFVLVFLICLACQIFIVKAQTDLNSPSLDITRLLPTTIDVHYTVQGGDGTPVTTQVFLNQQLDTISNCNDTDCTFNSLNPEQSYNITILFTDATTFTNITQIINTPSYLNEPILNSKDVHTTWITLNLTLSGGDNSQEYLIDITSVGNVSPSMTFTCELNNTFEICTIDNLIDNTDQSLLVKITNGNQINSTTISFKTFQSIQLVNLTYEVLPNVKGVNFTYNLVGGLGDSIVTNGYGCNNTDCLISYSYLIQGTNATFTFIIENDNTILTFPVTLYIPWSANNLFTIATQLVTATSFGIRSNYDGNPQTKRYTIYVNNVLQTHCSNNVDLCQMTGLSAATAYFITGSVYDGQFNFTRPATSPVNVRTQVAINTPTLTQTITTKSIKIDYSILGGATQSALKRNYVQLNGVNVTGCTQATCTMNNLKDGTTYNVTVVFTSEGYVVLASRMMTTFKNITAPIINFSRGYGKLVVNWVTLYGVPGTSRYNVFANGTIVTGCSNLLASSCVVSNLQIGETLDFRVDVTNDDDLSNNTNSYFIIPEPTLSVITTTTTFDSIILNWTESISSIPLEQTTYTAMISFDSFTWFRKCLNTASLSCVFDNLPQNTTYSTRVDINSPGFSPNENYKSLTTLFSNETITCPKSNSQVQCNGKGTCVEGICQCDVGFTGHACEWKLNDSSKVAIKSSSNKPLLDFGNGEGYQFSMSRLVEVDANGATVATIDIATEIWELVTSNIAIITHPTNGSPVSQVRRVYILSKNSPNAALADNIAITFTQLVPIAGTLGDNYPYEFAGDDFAVTYGAVKFTIRVSKWAFTSFDNQLQIHSELTVAPACLTSPVSLTFDNNANRSFALVYSQFQSKGRSVYSRFINRAMSDALPRAVSHKMTQSSTSFNGSYTTKATIISTFGNFRSQLLYDPDFAASGLTTPLCASPTTGGGATTTTSSTTASGDTTSTTTSGGESNPSTEDESAWKITVGVVVGVVGLALVATAIFLTRQRYMMKSRQGQPKRKKQKNSNRFGIDLEKVGGNN